MAHKHVGNIKGVCVQCGMRMFWPVRAAMQYETLQIKHPRNARGRFVSKLQLPKEEEV